MPTRSFRTLLGAHNHETESWDDTVWAATASTECRRRRSPCRLRFVPQAVDVAQNRVKPRPLGFERVFGDGVPGPPMHAEAFRSGHGERSRGGSEQGLRVVLGNQAALFMPAEAAVADAVQGHHEAARGHGFQRGEIEPLPFAGQADDDPALAKQREERASVEEFQIPAGARCALHPVARTTLRKVRALVADDRDWPAALVEPRR